MHSSAQNAFGFDSCQLFRALLLSQSALPLVVIAILKIERSQY